MELCRHENPELWFIGTKRATAKAKKICERCPAREACLAHALEQRISHGIWGGLTPTERDRILRPPKRRKRRASSLPKPFPSAVRGVSWKAEKGRWIVSLRHGGKTHWVGSWPPEQKAQAEAAAIAKCAELDTATVRSRSGKVA